VRDLHRRAALSVRATGALAVVLALGARLGGAWADEPPPVVVFAAVSLSQAFGALESEFRRDHPERRAVFNFEGSSRLVHQIHEGMRADVFASADETNMESARADGALAGPPRIFARNTLVIAVQPGNPKGIRGLADLGRPGLTVALCAPDVPAGRYARQAFAKAGVAVPEASQELDVRAALVKVMVGEADAAIVYATDVRTAGDRVTAVALPPEHDVVARYPIAVLKDAQNPAAARAFVDFVLGPTGQAVLGRFGFLAP